jgi:hypothetical protein
MNKTSVSCVAALLLFEPWGSLLAHHGTAGSYDQNKVVTVKGTVKEFRWRNPHSALFLVGVDQSGKQVDYALELGSPVTMVRMGLNRNSMKPGDAAVLEMHPSFTNPTSGECVMRQMIINGKPLVLAGLRQANESP